MPTAELLAAWKPRQIASAIPGRFVVDVAHSDELFRALTAEIEALDFEGPVARLAAASVVNMQDQRDFGLTGDVRDGFMASKALTAIKAWAEAQSVAQRKAA